MRGVLGVLLAIVLALPARAAEIHVLTVGAVQYALKGIAADFSEGGGENVIFVIGSPAQIVQKLAAGERADILIMAMPAMDDFQKTGGLRVETRTKLARTGLGVAVRASGPMPDLATAEDFKSAVRAARTIVYGDPTIPNQSGAQAQAVLASAGLIDEVRGKVREAGLGPGLDLIAKGEADLGLFNVSEIMPAVGKGAALAGPVPAPYQRYLAYDAAVMSAATSPDRAAAFVAFMAGAAPRWRAAGLEPAPY